MPKKAPNIISDRLRGNLCVTTPRGDVCIVIGDSNGYLSLRSQHNTLFRVAVQQPFELKDIFSGRPYRDTPSD